MLFSPKHQIVKIGEMLHSKIVRRDFFSAEMKNQAIKPRENVRRAFLFFVLNTNLSNEEKSSAKNCPLAWKSVCCQAVEPSFAWPIWLQLTDGTIYSWGLRVAFLSSRTAAVAGCADVCPHGNPNWYIVFVSCRPSFLSGLYLFIMFCQSLNVSINLLIELLSF